MLLKASDSRSVLSLLLAHNFGSSNAAAGGLARVNKALLGLKFMDDTLPTGELSCSKTTADEFAFLTRCAAVALLAEPRLSALLEVVVGEVHNVACPGPDEIRASQHS